MAFAAKGLFTMFIQIGYNISIRVKSKKINKKRQVQNYGSKITL